MGRRIAMKKTESIIFVGLVAVILSGFVFLPHVYRGAIQFQSRDAAAPTVLKDIVPDGGTMDIGAQFSVTVETAGKSVQDALPVATAQGKWTIDMSRAGQPGSSAPKHALIEVKGERHFACSRTTTCASSWATG
jgi:hypothetical protein